MAPLAMMCYFYALSASAPATTPHTFWCGSLRPEWYAKRIYCKVMTDQRIAPNVEAEAKRSGYQWPPFLMVETDPEWKTYAAGKPLPHGYVAGQVNNTPPEHQPGAGNFCPQAEMAVSAGPQSRK